MIINGIRDYLSFIPLKFYDLSVGASGGHVVLGAKDKGEIFNYEHFGNLYTTESKQFFTKTQ